MKRILGLDLGTTSIGWAFVNEAEKENEKSTIIKTGVRIIPLSTDESDDFNKGKSITVNSDRTLKRGARRNLDRYQLRRQELIKILINNGIINGSTVFAENGKNSTHSLWKIRSKSANSEIPLEDFARVLLSINKKRGYKSNRKSKDESDGQAIDGMEIAKQLYKNDQTPGQYIFKQLKQGKKNIPEFYRSDLKNEFDKIWNTQRKYYNDILTPEFKEELYGKNKGHTWKLYEKPFKIVGLKLKGKRDEIKLKKYELRESGITKQLNLEHLAIVLQEINTQINNSSGYLGAISDRSKELYFNNQTVGQYLYGQIKNNPHIRLKNQVFYRQDYLDEFEKIWETQARFHKELTKELKIEIRDVIIFYQRRLKSQKGLISICELEGEDVEIDNNGIKKTKTIGPRAIPKSSPLFQEFKIWQTLNNIEIRNLETREIFVLDKEYKKDLFNELTNKDKLSASQVLKLLVKKPKQWELNFTDGIDGNKTYSEFYSSFKKISELSGHDIDFSKMTFDKIYESLSEIFDIIGINKKILSFNSSLKGKGLVRQPFYELWHLLYSYEGDNSKSGNDALYNKLNLKFGISKEYAKPLLNISFQEGYGSLSAKAIKKILPYLKDGHEYSKAAELAGYRHSKHSLSKEELENRILDDKLKILSKNSLRNPVVEKVLNQMINVVNAIIEKYGKPDEIRIELARELKKSAKERAEMTKNINQANTKHDNIRSILKNLYPFNSGVRITRNDIIKYKLYEELKNIGYKTIYTNTYIPLEKLFSKEFDIEHIIPKALLFDDSFSNKTLSSRDFNLTKSNLTGIDAIITKYGKDSQGYADYINRIENLFKNKIISRTKYKKLIMKGVEIPDGFIERDLRNSQYIAKKAINILEKVVRKVGSTTGKITNRLREDWQIINVLQELNWEKYKTLGLTYYETNKEGNKIPKIKDWTKRNDHRHHIMDAITVAFTKQSHVQYLNNLNARRDENNKMYNSIYGIEQKETFINNGKRLIKPPIPIDQFRLEVKKHLDNTLVSFKTKNKVVTRNINKIKKKVGFNKRIELTPRGQLHKETIYGVSKQYVTKEETVGTKFDINKIMLVAIKSHRDALLKRLQENGNKPKKAFGGINSPSKRPIYLDEFESEKLPKKVKLVWLENRFTIRKEISPDNFKTAKNIEKIIDIGLKNILLNRLKEFNNNSKKAFGNLEENPIWLNKEKGIQVKRVKISGVSNAEPLHSKKDHLGKNILDKTGLAIPADYVSTGNNHHVAIYKDEKGNLQEEIVSFYEAVARVIEGLPIINKHHEKGWKFLFSMKQNEMFVFPNKATGFDLDEIDLEDEKNYHLISPNLFRVQKFTNKDYFFRHHLETNVDDNKLTKNFIWKRVGLKGIIGIVKLRINHLGQIVKIGEF